jgi:hypothetical protein
MTKSCTTTSVLATVLAGGTAHAQSTVGTDAPQAPVLAPASAQERCAKGCVTVVAVDGISARG